MLQFVMVQLAAWFRLPSLKLPTFHQVFAEETAQDAFEYMLVVGIVCVGVVVAMAAFPGLIPTVVSSVSSKLTSAISTGI